MPFYFPIFLNLQDRPCVVIGGGSVAERKVQSLLDAGADVTLIAPQLTAGLQALTDAGRIRHIPRRYAAGDLSGAFLAISATDDQAVNEEVWQEAVACNVLVNVVDDPARCSFIAPAIVRRGDLTIAISTGGQAPALAVRLRQQLTALFGPEYATFLEWLGTLRQDLSEHLPDPERRRRLWYTLVDSDILDLLREGQEAEAQERFRAILKEHLGPDDR